jgi:hypothetical protein
MDADLAQARRFLRRLDPEAPTFTFQLATDAPPKEKPKPDPLAEIITAPCTRLKALARRNAQDRAAIWVMINEGDGRGRSAANVTRVRAVFADVDGQVTLDQLREFDPEPHLIVESSPGHFQPYWLCTGLPVEKFEGVQRRIAETFGTDHITDPCRVMRCAGFLHKKRKPFPVRVVHERRPSASPICRRPNTSSGERSKPSGSTCASAS